jgi:hypothetical protein
MSIKRAFPFKLLSAAMIVLIQSVGLAPLVAAPLSSIEGTVISAGDQGPLAGLRVHMADPVTGKIYTAEPTGTDGSFIVIGLPSATYEIAIESNGGLYLVPSPVSLDAGQSRVLNLVVHPDHSKPGLAAKSGSMAVWSNPLTAALIVVGSAIGVGVLLDSITDDDTTGPIPSPSMP